MGEFFALKRDLTWRSACDRVSVDNAQNIKWYIHIGCCQYLAHLKLFEQFFPSSFSGLEGISGFWHLVGTYELVFGQRVEGTIKSVSKEVTGAIAFCHRWPLFNQAVCGLLGNCIVLESLCFKKQTETGWRDVPKGRAALRTEAEGAHEKPALVPPCLSSSQPGSLRSRLTFPEESSWHPSPRWPPWGTVPPGLHWGRGN